MRSLPSQVARALAVAGTLVCGAGLLVELLVRRGPDDDVPVVLGLFSLSYEANVPTWYSSSLLLLCAAALAAIAATAPARRRHWAGLAAGFATMSLDEAVELHEHLGGLFGTGGLLYFDWVIPAAVVVALVALAYLPFLRALPARRRGWFVLAGTIYVAGAVGMELPLGWWTARAGDDNLGYALIDWVEETLEIVGASIFLVALAERWAARAEATP